MGCSHQRVVDNPRHQCPQLRQGYLWVGCSSASARLRRRFLSCGEHPRAGKSASGVGVPRKLEALAIVVCLGWDGGAARSRRFPLRFDRCAPRVSPSRPHSLQTQVLQICALIRLSGVRRDVFVPTLRLVSESLKSSHHNSEFWGGTKKKPYIAASCAVSIVNLVQSGLNSIQ